MSNQIANYTNDGHIEPSAFIQLSKPPSTVITLSIISFASFVAFFDFTIFVFSVDTINSAFFPTHSNALVTKLQTMTVLTAGFIARPVGAWLIGRYGDKQGRKRALHLCMSLFVIGAAIASILPTYAQIGLLAPILLILLRLLQGAAFAAQLIVGWVFLAESLPRNKLANAISICLTAVFIGSIACSSLYYFLESTLSSAAMLSYGWRLMFVTSFILSLVAFLLTRRLAETPLFYLKNCVPTPSLAHNTLLLSPTTPSCVCDIAPPDTVLNDIKELSAAQAYYHLDFNHFSAVLITAFLALIGTSLALLVALVLPQLLVINYSVSAALLRGANVTGIAGLIIGILFYGYIADKIGAAKALMLGSIILAISALGFYSYCATSDMSLIVPFYGIFGFASGIDLLCIYILIRVFPIHNRLMATGVIYNVVTVFTGALLPFALTYATHIFAFAPTLYVLFICICAFMIGLYVQQSPTIYELETLPEHYE